MNGAPDNVVPISANQPLGVQHEYISLNHENGGSGGAAGGNDGADMNERIGRLEGAIEGLRHSENLVLGVIVFVGALLIGLGTYSLTRVDQLNDKIVAVPAQVSADMRDLTKTLAATITASKQQAPQVILLPTPSPSPSNENKGPHR